MANTKQQIKREKRLVKKQAKLDGKEFAVAWQEFQDDKKRLAEEKAKQEAEEKAKKEAEDKINNPTQEQLLKEIRDLLKQQNDKE